MPKLFIPIAFKSKTATMNLYDISWLARTRSQMGRVFAFKDFYLLPEVAKRYRNKYSKWRKTKACKKIISNLYRNQWGLCYHCGINIKLQRNTPLRLRATLDHIIPIAAGGKNCERNLVLACHPCNAGKGAR